jgi:hypothetical protein
VFGLHPSLLERLTNLQMHVMNYLWVASSDLLSSQMIAVSIDLVQVQNQIDNYSVVQLPAAYSLLAS